MVSLIWLIFSKKILKKRAKKGYFKKLIVSITPFLKIIRLLFILRGKLRNGELRGAVWFFGEERCLLGRILPHSTSPGDVVFPNPSCIPACHVSLSFSPAARPLQSHWIVS